MNCIKKTQVMSGHLFHDSDNNESLGMDTSVFSDYKENDRRFILPFIYAPLATITLSNGSCSDTEEDHDGSDSSDEDSARLACIASVVTFLYNFMCDRSWSLHGYKC